MDSARHKASIKNCGKTKEAGHSKKNNKKSDEDEKIYKEALEVKPEVILVYIVNAIF